MVSAFALFPLVAIFYQFGWKQSLVAAVVVLMTRVVVVRYFPHLNPESIEIFIGMVMLLGIAITHTCVIVMKMILMPAGFRCLKNARRGLSKTYPISPSWEH
ncbi:YhfT family protein [Escherichia coli]|uniref:YhfT family protein n=1 Tax=Escherichia coli TaxID=562 RepID=UPI003EC7F415